MLSSSFNGKVGRCIPVDAVAIVSLSFRLDISSAAPLASLYLWFTFPVLPRRHNKEMWQAILAEMRHNN